MIGFDATRNAENTQTLSFDFYCVLVTRAPARVLENANVSTDNLTHMLLSNLPTPPYITKPFHLMTNQDTSLPLEATNQQQLWELATS